MKVATNQTERSTSAFDGTVALVHDWLPVYAGAERVLEQMIRVLPQADLYTLLDFIPPDERAFLGDRRVRTSFIQRLPFARDRYRMYLPLCPLAIEGFDVTGYDVVVSSSYAVAKGVLTTPDQLHISYVHSPLRYAWDLQFQYLREGRYNSGVRRFLARVILHYMRLYDVASAARPDLLLANSRYVARRIWKTYRRPAAVIYPPVDTDAFPIYRRKEDFYVTVSRLVPYKRVDLLVKAFNAMPYRELLVIGDGPDFDRLNAMAEPNVVMLGHQPAEAVVYYLQRARAFVFAALEDFGIAPIEAQACGTPTIAYGRGGATETVLPGISGILFDEQSVDSIVDAVSRFEQERERFQAEAIRENAKRFSAVRFRIRFADVVEQAFRHARSGAGIDSFDVGEMLSTVTGGNGHPHQPEGGPSFK